MLSFAKESQQSYNNERKPMGWPNAAAHAQRQANDW
jgi:hypothetical protein